ncbi:transporter substrate-binding domain-containing protein [Sporosarcina sp. BP05]|uniref:transporter substrate-binding domain-containing protein n=1 Tax=Sporosarcina sp. BP05 TaxID=2758726 RepID=UPI001647628A
MRKILFVLIGCSLALFGCTAEKRVEDKNQFEDLQVDNDEEMLVLDKEVQIEDEENKYKIEKITIPIELDMQQGPFKVYHDFSYALIKEMAKEFNIPVEVREFATTDDSDIALRRGVIDLITGVIRLEPEETELTKTYSYFTGTLIKPNGEEVLSERSYAMVVRKGNKELINFLNDNILNFKESGKLEQLQNEYLGNREK